jgi:hypothetical protein
MNGYSSPTEAGVFSVLDVPLPMTGPVPRPVSADSLAAISGSFRTPRSRIQPGGSARAPGMYLTAFASLDAAPTEKSLSPTPGDIRMGGQIGLDRQDKAGETGWEGQHASFLGEARWC